ncbi:blastomere cadherin-like [Eleutherodactylus coqui]
MRRRDGQTLFHSYPKAGLSDISESSGTMRFSHLALSLLLIKVSIAVSENQEQCEPGFSEQRYAFSVTRKVLERNRIIGRVTFTSCSENNRALYSPDDTRFRVFPDGKITVKRQLTLHDGSVSFVLNAWDATGTRHSVPIFVWNEREQQAVDQSLGRS